MKPTVAYPKMVLHTQAVIDVAVGIANSSRDVAEITVALRLAVSGPTDT
jgi:hypothetical protein